MSETETAPLGHNKPPVGLSDIYNFDAIPELLGDRYSDLRRRVKEFVAAYDRWTKLVTVPKEATFGGTLQDAQGNVITEMRITSDDIQERTVAFGRQIDAILKEIETAREQVKLPFRKAGEAVDGFFKKTVVDGLEPAKPAIVRLLTAYGNQKIAKARDEAAAKAKADAEAAARIAEIAAQTGSDEAMNQAIALEEQAMAAAATAASPQAAREAASVRTAEGGSAHMQGKYEPVLVDPALVPREYCEPVPALVRAAIQQEKRLKGSVAPDFIPGYRIDFVTTARIR